MALGLAVPRFSAVVNRLSRNHDSVTLVLLSCARTKFKIKANLYVNVGWVIWARYYGDRSGLETKSPSNLNTTSKVDMERYPWLGKPPYGFWSKKENQRLYLDWLGEKLGFKTREDWYKVRYEDFEGAHSLLLRYFSSPQALVSAIYSDYKYLPWLFNASPRGFWTDRENRRKYVEWLMETVKVKEAKDLQQRHFRENSGGGLILLHGNSPNKVLLSLIEPSEAGSPKVISSLKPRNYWGSLENQREFLNAVGSKLGVQGNDISPWYEITRKKFHELGGATLLNLYNNSVYAMLRKVYPDFEWIPWKFIVNPRYIHRDPEIVSNALEYVEKELNMATPEDWYRVSKPQLSKLGLLKFFINAGGLLALLQKYRPSIEWDDKSLLKAHGSKRG